MTVEAAPAPQPVRRGRAAACRARSVPAATSSPATTCAVGDAMPLADSSRAIGAVTGLLTQRIELLTAHNVTIGRPEPPNANGGISNPRLNLFLYEAVFDPNLRNTPLDEGQEAPLWLVVRYLMTPFDDAGESDTADAYRVLGDGLRALQSLALLPVAGLQPEDQAALDPNPQQLRLTFNEAPSSLLSTLMQGTDEKYRFSMCFEVRPLMIAPAAPAAYSLLVGVDYTGAPGADAANGGIGLSVEPTLGPMIDRVTPSSFKAGDPPVRIDGTDLDIVGLEVQLGPGAAAARPSTPPGARSSTPPRRRSAAPRSPRPATR